MCELPPQILRDTIQRHTVVEPPAPQPPPRIAAMGAVRLPASAPLLGAVAALAGTAATKARYPDIMEEYGQR